MLVCPTTPLSLLMVTSEKNKIHAGASGNFYSLGGPVYPQPRPPPTPRLCPQVKSRGGKAMGSQRRRHITTSVPFKRGPVSLGAGGGRPQSRCCGASRGHRTGMGTTGGGARASPKVAVSRVQPLAVERGGGGQGAPVAKGGGGGVHAVAVHGRGAPQARVGGDRLG